MSLSTALPVVDPTMCSNGRKTEQISLERPRPHSHSTLVSDADGGEYTCVVSNAAGNETTSVTLYIRPYIVLDPQQQLLAVVGSFVTFTCGALSFPSPSYLWERVDDPGFESLGQNLTLGPISYSDGGSVYRCVAFITVNMTNYTAQSEDGLLIGV